MVADLQPPGVTQRLRQALALGVGVLHDQATTLTQQVPGAVSYPQWVATRWAVRSGFPREPVPASSWASLFRQSAMVL